MIIELVVGHFYLFVLYFYLCLCCAVVSVVLIQIKDNRGFVISEIKISSTKI